MNKYKFNLNILLVIKNIYALSYCVFVTINNDVPYKGTMDITTTPKTIPDIMVVTYSLIYIL